ncbi:hypothetical protein [Streptomyces stramineus]|uniref:hypothetical protein n=1 Tax=Streptomyces stramineus TaxID=173861 RepID=UPI0031D314A9
MGIESDQLVYDYLSRVGDLAQRRALTSGDRMRLVARLRSEIEQRRSSEGAETPAAVQRILAGLGTPDEAVAGVAPRSGHGTVPVQRVDDTVMSPHLAPESELSPSAEVPDWWRVEPGPFTPGDAVHGFTGGVEIPEMLKPPPPRDGQAGERTAAVERTEADTGTAGTGEEAGTARASLLRRADGAPVPPLLLLVALILLVGALLGNWYVVAAGWGLAYLTRTLSRTESWWAVMGLPGLVLAAGAVWLWGRTEGRWGDPVPEGALGSAVADALPWLVRAAAVASAGYVTWRSRRPG